jgi:transcriptional regulator with XRE-family HTH domain
MGREVGVRLRHARKLKGLTQVQLAKSSGVKQSTISEVETGESKSPVGTNLVRLAQTLSVSPEWLAAGKGPMVASDPPLPIEAQRVARDWLKLAPEVRKSIASMIREMVKESASDAPAVPDERVAEAYGKPGEKSKR